MRVSVARIVRVVCVAVCAFCLVQTMEAAKSRLFSGSYQLSSVSETQKYFHLTLTLKLWNHGSGDVSGGVVLFDSEPNPAALGSFSGTKAEVFHGNSQVTLVQVFDVPKAEYARWQEGREPALSVVTQDANGALRLHSIDLDRDKTAPALQQ